MTNEEAKCFIWRNHCCDCQNMNCHICPYAYAMRTLESIDRITVERDEAVKDLHDSEQMHNACFFCKHYDETAFCNNNVGGCDNEADDRWEWRGAQNDKT